jgi:ppGpp synthetase/RelA/SpoT-type nucleotidyltranferase
MVQVKSYVRGLPDLKKETRLKKFLLADFDKDGVKNVDDAYPLDSKRSRVKGVGTRKKVVGVDFASSEVKLSDQLLAIEKNNEAHVEPLRKVLATTPESFGRVKSVASTLGKLRDRHLNKLEDIAASTILVKDRAEAYKVLEELKQKYTIKEGSLDDYYVTPKNGIYRALHLTVLVDGKPVEVQVKTKRAYKFHKRIHGKYKTGGYSAEDYFESDAIHSAGL